MPRGFIPRGFIPRGFIPRQRAARGTVPARWPGAGTSATVTPYPGGCE
jgi:hypothetical protein